jgi:hypothetical protein
MSATWKKTIKACLRPLYYRLPAPILGAIRRWREARAARPTRLLAEGSRGAAELLLAHMEESDRLLLAALKMTQPASTHSAVPAFSAVSLGNDRLLAAHSHEPFIYLDARDLRQTPHIIAGRFERGVQQALERLVQPGATVIELGAGQGFHTLALARLVAPTGKVLAIESDPAAFAVLHDNLTAHQLGDVVTALPCEFGREADTLRDCLVTCRHRASLLRIDARIRLPGILDPLQAILEADPHLMVLVPFVPSLGPEVLVRLAGQSRRFWRLDEDGELEVTPRQLLDGPPRKRIDVLVAADLPG